MNVAWKSQTKDLFILWRLSIGQIADEIKILTGRTGFNSECSESLWGTNRKWACVCVWVCVWRIKCPLLCAGVYESSSSSLSSLPQLREEFDRGVDIRLDEDHSVHDVAALLKEFLRDMPDPLLTKELYTAFINTTCKLPHPSSPFSSSSSSLSSARSRLCFSVGLRWAAERDSAPHLPAPSMQQWHASPPAEVPVHCGRPCSWPAGQRGAGGQWSSLNWGRNTTKSAMCMQLTDTNARYLIGIGVCDWYVHTHFLTLVKTETCIAEHPPNPSEATMGQCV